ncbi:MAG: hypothetical protein AABZ47_06410 [Planctomycetota bacterium]
MLNLFGKKMMRTRVRAAGLAMIAGTLFQFGGCNLGQITTTSTLDGRDAIIQILRALIITPIDTLLSNAINQAIPAQ